MSEINLDHIVTGYEVEEFQMTDLTPSGLSVSIGNMTDRATALANLLLPYYDGTDHLEPDNRTMYFAINSIRIELMNIQKTVEAFSQANKPQA